MARRMMLVRRHADGALEPMGDPLGESAIVQFMHDTDLGGIIAVEAVTGFEGFDYLASFDIEFVDARGTVEYLTNFDPRRIFPEVPASSHWIMHAER